MAAPKCRPPSRSTFPGRIPPGPPLASRPTAPRYRRVGHVPEQRASSLRQRFSPGISPRCQRARHRWAKRLCAAVTPVGVARRHAGKPVALLARRHREQPCRSAPWPDRAAPAARPPPVARSIGPRANGRLLAQRFFPRARSSAALRAPHPPRLFPKRISLGRCNRRATEVITRLPLPQGRDTALRRPVGAARRPYHFADHAWRPPHSRFPSFRCQRALENNLEDPREAFLRHHSEFFHLWRIHDRLDHRQQNFDDELGRNIFAHHSRPLPLDKKFSKVALDQSGSTAFDEFEDVWSFLAHITHERRLDLVQFALRTSQQLAQSRRQIV